MTTETRRTVRSIDDLDDYDEEGEALAPLRSSFNNKNKRTSRRIHNAEAALKEKVVYDYDLKTYAHEKPMREWRFTLPCMREPIIMNPVTTLIGIVPLWGAAIWCMVSNIRGY